MVDGREFTADVRSALRDAGFANADLLSQDRESSAFGDTAAVFDAGPVLLRFVRDRGQVFIDVAAPSAPSTFHQFDDLDIAMGWRTIDEVLSKRGAEPIESVLQRAMANIGTLHRAFSIGCAPITAARLRDAARDRGMRLVSRLRRSC